MTNKQFVLKLAGITCVAVIGWRFFEATKAVAK